MKYVLVGVIVAGMAYIGYGLSYYYRIRKKFFEDIILFCEKLSVDISFSKEILSSIVLNNLGNFSKEFRMILNEYLFYLKNNGTTLNKDSLFNKVKILKDEEKDSITIFFKSLGKLDMTNQINEIDNFKTKFISYKNTADEENKKFGALSLKLMFLLGLLIVIILI